MNCIAIIPVRGGSRGIPRKNARLIGGKPLLAHTVETARKVELLQQVYVSTDDAELAEIARRYGATVLDRPAELATDKVALDAVICDAVRQIEVTGVALDYVVSIQATAPLLRPESVQRAIAKCSGEQLDTVLSVVNDTHLCWCLGADGSPQPLYKARVNRQFLPAVFRETGGVVVARRAVLETGTRFGKRVGFIELDKAESLDIDDRFDWWLVEKSLARRRICFHVIGNRHDGLGHVHRALTLADRLIDHELCFVVNEEADLARSMIEARFYPCKVAARGQEVLAIRDSRPDLLINDVLDTTESYISAVRSAVPALKMINFEDLGPSRHQADCVINEMYDHAEGDLTAQNVLCGTSVCCLRDEFYSVKPITVLSEVGNLLLMFGGTDPNDLTLTCLRWVDEMPGTWTITAILGLGYTQREAVEAYAKAARHPVEVVVNSKAVSRYMAQADLAISSAGRTVFELASVGVPTIVIAQNERECHHVFARKALGVINLGRAQDLTASTLRATVRQLLESRVLRLIMHQALLDTDVRSGIDRVLKVIQNILHGTSDQRTKHTVAVDIAK